MHRLLPLCVVGLASCSRAPIAISDSGPPAIFDSGPPAPDHQLGVERQAPVPPPPDYLPPDLKPPGSCQPGERRWCDGLQYDGYGQVACDPATGRWREKMGPNGQAVLDCVELANGERPNTVCACYHFFFSPACCERPDCVLLPGESGAICPASKGQLCDYCNPQKPECKESGAQCVITNSYETFCARACSSDEPCPPGYQCMVVKLKTGTTNQCIPSDFSCYY